VLKFLGVIAAIAPRLAVKPESLTDKLTHDPEITARHHADESIGLRGTKATVRVGMESQRAQAWLLEHIHEWARYPIFAVLAGQDYLADFRTSEATLRKIPPKLLTLKIYEENYHENFNELNREEIYEEILTWVKALDGRSNLGT
jgi:alpha-beta hydrolase superfamily lysophospholipase